MENQPLKRLHAHDRLLLLLKTRGRSSTGDLAMALGITGEAVRQQLVRLEADGLVEAASEARGVGRPTQLWQLTTAANSRFPDTHAELTTQLIETIRSTLGESALNKVIAAREKVLQRDYTIALEGTQTLKERVERLASIRNSEGYMAEWRAEGTGFQLIENHCPICTATAACMNLCDAELKLFRSILGPDVSVSREEHIFSGARRCAYRIEHKSLVNPQPGGAAKN
ncbi:MAG TPA: metalloregulator ArsR/SmtB family transcription factor [Candidatus Angelobacter sp.]|nr:metalloregulator ArsR/SmtB family transcription factor [Candidatus Angelobacter sp.]